MLKSLFGISFLISAFPFASCKTSPTNPAAPIKDTSVNSTGDLTVIPCDVGEKTYIALTPTKLDLTKEIIKLPGADFETEMMHPSWEHNAGFYIEACLDGSTILPQRYVALGSGGFDHIIGTVESAEGLDEALFSQDFSKINIKIKDSSDPLSTIQITGKKISTDSSKTYVFAYPLFENSPTSISVWVGELTPMESTPVRATKCGFSGTFNQSKLEIKKQFKIEFDTCNSMGGGFTVSYHVLKLVLTDLVTKQVTAIEKDRSSAIGEIGASDGMVLPPPPNFQFKVNHHNGCDSFVIRTSPKHIYAFTTGSASGCATQLPEAPQRKLEAQDNSTLLYTVTRDTKVSKGTSNCSHPIVGCDRSGGASAGGADAATDLPSVQ